MSLQSIREQLGDIITVVRNKPLSPQPVQRPLPVAAPRSADDDDEYEDAEVIDEEEYEDEEDEDEAEYNRYRQRIYQSQSSQSAAGAHGIMRRWWIKIAQALLALVCWVYLSLGNAQLFAGFQPILTNGWTFLAYIGGFSFEFAGMALIFVAGIRWEQKKYPGFAMALLSALFMALVSFVTQIVFVTTDLLGSHLPAVVLAVIPFGLKGYVGLRSLVPTVLEFTLVFLVAEKVVSVEETIEQQRRERQAIHQLMVEDERAHQESMANKAMTALMRAGTEAMEQSANLLVDNQQVLLQELKPKMYIQHIHHEAEPQIPQQAASKTLTRQKGVPLPDDLAYRVQVKPPVYCSDGHANAASARFCNVCGTSLQARPAAVSEKRPVAPPVPKSVSLSTDEEKLRYARANMSRYQSLDKAMKDLAPKYGGESQARFWLLKAQADLDRPVPSNGHKTPGDDLGLDDASPFL